MTLPAALALKRQDLFRTQAFIAGHWVSEAAGQTFSVDDPARETVIAAVADCGADMALAAIDAADAGYPSWRDSTAKERSRLLRAWHDLVIRHRDDLARLISAEQGKPLAEAEAEITYAAGYLDWYAEEAKRAYGDIIPSPVAGRELLVFKEPVGIVAVITPWNFPMAMIARKFAPALAAGCTVVAKPAAETPLTALALELGGNAPLIVFDDADLDITLASLIKAKFRNAGQACIAANRVYVHSGIYDNFVKRVVDAVGGMTVGAAASGPNDIGPLIHARAARGMAHLVDDALSQGARLLIGGKPRALGGNFFEPTVLADPKAKMKVCSQEIFGRSSC